MDSLAKRPVFRADHPDQAGGPPPGPHVAGDANLVDAEQVKQFLAECCSYSPSEIEGRQMLLVQSGSRRGPWIGIPFPWTYSIFFSKLCKYLVMTIPLKLFALFLEELKCCKLEQGG